MSGLFRGVLLAVSLSACSMITGVKLEQETVTAACGTCIFKAEGVGCFWAIEWDGAYYPVNGHTPEDHDPHGEDGMCTMPRKAVVSGTLRSGQLLADAFELLPATEADRAAGSEHGHVH